MAFETVSRLISRALGRGVPCSSARAAATYVLRTCHFAEDFVRVMAYFRIVSSSQLMAEIAERYSDRELYLQCVDNIDLVVWNKSFITNVNKAIVRVLFRELLSAARRPALAPSMLTVSYLSLSTLDMQRLRSLDEDGFIVRQACRVRLARLRSTA